MLATSTEEETEPVGVTEQPRFLNQVISVDTDLEPVALLRLCKQIEAEAGRKPGPRWGPRPLDVDILLYGELVLEMPELVIPHPELAHREFVLRELLEIAPDIADPRSGQKLATERRARK